MGKYSNIDEMRDLFSIKGLVAVVTGAASGIGQGIAFAWAANGGKLVISDINEDGLKETEREIRSVTNDVVSVVADVTKLDDVKRLVNESVRAFGNIDALYIVPGINIRKSILSYTYDEFERVLRVNLWGTYYLLKEFGNVMIKNPRGGSIVLISSIRHLVVEPGQSAYAATKAAIVQLAKTAAAEWAKYNIRVNVIAPGVVETELTQQIKKDPAWYEAYRTKPALKRWATVREIAGPAIFLATPAASYITGTVIYVDGGWTAIDGRYEPNIP